MLGEELVQKFAFLMSVDEFLIVQVLAVKSEEEGISVLKIRGMILVIDRHVRD